MRKNTVLVCAVAAVSVLFAGAPVWAQLVPQPAGSHSFLIQNDGTGIRDDDFANIMKNALMPGGTNNIYDAKFLFQTCFGGGMLDDLQSQFGATVDWVGASASQWDQESIGQVSTAENNARPPAKQYGPQWVADPPQDFWTKAFLQNLITTPTTQTMSQAIAGAGLDDSVGPHPSGSYTTLEHPQSVTANGGETIQLKEPGALSYHAILWAGDPDSMRHYDDIANMRTALMNAWGTGGNITIDVLFGDGSHAPDGSALPAAWNAQAATRANLVALMNSLPLDSDEQFLFYASDHGGDSHTVQAPTDPPRMVPAHGSTPFMTPLTPNELEGLDSGETTGSYLTIDYSGVATGGADGVYLNGILLGYLDPALSSIELPILPDDFTLNNEIDISSGEGADFGISDLELFTGIGDMAPPLGSVPEPVTLWLLALGVAALLRRRISSNAR